VEHPQFRHEQHGDARIRIVRAASHQRRGINLVAANLKVITIGAGNRRAGSGRVGLEPHQIVVDHLDVAVWVRDVGRAG
jgi:hypothetical protein